MIRRTAAAVTVEDVTIAALEATTSKASVISSMSTLSKMDSRNPGLFLKFLLSLSIVVMLAPKSVFAYRVALNERTPPWDNLTAIFWIIPAIETPGVEEELAAA